MACHDAVTHHLCQLLLCTWLVTFGSNALAAPQATVALAAAAPTKEPAPANDPKELRRAYFMVLVEARQPSIMTGKPVRDAEQAERFRQTQAVQATSLIVIDTALRNLPKEHLGFIPKGLNPSDWLRENLVAIYPKGSSVLEVALPHETAKKEDLIAVASALSKSYMDEVVFRQDIRRRKPRTILTEVHRKVEEEIRRDSDSYHELLRKRGSVRHPAIAVRLELTKKQIDRLEAEKLLLKRTLLKRKVDILGEAADEAISQGKINKLTQAFEERIAEIDKKLHSHTIELHASSRFNLDLDDRADKIATLKKAREEIALSIRRMDVELRGNGPIQSVGGIGFYDPTLKAARER